MNHIWVIEYKLGVAGWHPWGTQLFPTRHKAESSMRMALQLAGDLRLRVRKWVRADARNLTAEKRLITLETDDE